MHVDYATFLDRVISDGIAACEIDYANKPEKREGSIAGFEVCRGKTPGELKTILENASRRTSEARRSATRDNYWRIRCFELEVEWVCNVVSAMLHNENQRVIIPPTARGYLKAAEILGVQSHGESARD